MIKKVLLFVGMFIFFSSYDMFLKMMSYQLDLNIFFKILLYNGIFDKSDNVIICDWMIDVSLVGNGQCIVVDFVIWMEVDNKIIFNFIFGDFGIWVVGVFI